MPVAPASGGGGQKSGDVRAGGAYVEISAKDRLTATLAALRAKALAFATGLQQIGKGIGFVGAAALAPLTAFFKGGVDRAEEVSKLAEQMGYTADQMQRVKYAADVAAVSVEDVLRLPEKYAGLMAQAPMMDADAIRRSVDANRALRAAFIDLQLALVPLIRAVAPVAQAFGAFVRDNPGLVTGLAAVAAGVTALGAASFAVGTAIKAALSPFVLVSAAVAGVGYGLARLTSHFFPETAAAAGKFFGDLGGLASDTMTGIFAAIAKGDLTLAFEVAGNGLTAVWKLVVLKLTEIWVDFKDTVLDSFRDFKAGFLAAFDPGVLKRLLGGQGVLGAVAGEAAPGGAIDAAARERDAQRQADRALRRKQIEDAAAQLAEARQRLAAAVAVAVAKPAAAVVDPLARQVTATRGAFRLLGDAGQQFGRVDTTEIAKRQLNTLERIQADMKVVADGIKAGVLTLRFR